MHILLFMLVFWLVDGSDLPEAVQVDKITGDWRTIAMATDNVMEIEGNGLLRAYFRTVHCENGCDTIRFRLYTKPKGECKLLVANASAGGASGLYKADVPGSNIFKIIYKSSSLMVIYAVYVEEEDSPNNTHLTLALGQGKSLSEEEKAKFEELTTFCNIPRQNIRYFSGKDPCPE